jgi:hypothetical protein
MALLTFQGFEGYSSVEDFMESNDDWDVTVDASTPYLTTGRMGGSCLKQDPMYMMAAILSYSFYTTNNTIIVGVAFKLENPYGDSVSNNIISTTGAGYGFTKFNIKYVGGNLVAEKIENTTSTIYGSIPIDEDTWYYLELKAYKHFTEGILQARLNEQLFADAYGDMRYSSDNDGFIKVSFKIDNERDTIYKAYFDDIYICDGSGSEFNDFLGDIRIDAVYPNGAGNHADLTPSVGNNYECVDESEFDDSDYVSSANVGDIDTYTYQDVPTEIDDSGIIALKMVSNAKRTVPADSVKIQHVIRQGSTDYNQASQSLPDAFKAVEDYVTEDPSDSNPWTKAKINSAEFGVEVG